MPLPTLHNVQPLMSSYTTSPNNFSPDEKKERKATSSSSSSTTPTMEETTNVQSSVIPVPEITITSPMSINGPNDDPSQERSAEDGTSAAHSPLLVSKVDPNLRRSVTGHLFHIFYMLCALFVIVVFEKKLFLIPFLITSILLLVPYYKKEVAGKTISIGGESWMCRFMHIVTSLATCCYFVYINAEGMLDEFDDFFRNDDDFFSTISCIFILLSSISAAIPQKSGLARYMSVFYEKVYRQKIYGLTRSISGTLFWLSMFAFYVLSGIENPENQVNQKIIAALICFTMAMPSVSSSPKLRFLLPVLNLMLSFSIGAFKYEKKEMFDYKFGKMLVTILKHTESDEVINIVISLSIVGVIACSYLPLCSRSAIWFSPIYNKISRADRKALKNDFGFTLKLESLFGVLTYFLILGMTYILFDNHIFDSFLFVSSLLLIPHVKSLFLANYRAIRYFLCGREGMKLKRSVWGTIYSMLFSTLLVASFFFAVVNANNLDDNRSIIYVILFYLLVILALLIQNPRVVLDQRIRGSIPIIIGSSLTIFAILRYEFLLHEVILHPFMCSIVSAIALLFPSYTPLESRWASWVQPLYREAKEFEEQQAGDIESNL